MGRCTGSQSEILGCGRKNRAWSRGGGELGKGAEQGRVLGSPCCHMEKALEKQRLERRGREEGCRAGTGRLTWEW